MNYISIEQISKLNRADAEKLVKEMLSISRAEWISYASKYTNELHITKHNIPQFSSFDDATVNVVSVILRNGNDGYSFDRIGRYLLPKGKKPVAYKKYGENHSKFASLLGFTTIESGKCKLVYATEFGKVFNNLQKNYQEEIIIRQLLLIPYINKIIFGNEIVVVKEDLKKYLAKTTAIRRGSNVNKIIKIIQKNYSSNKYIYLSEKKK